MATLSVFMLSVKYFTLSVFTLSVNYFTLGIECFYARGNIF